jgi:hypothetical protein
MSRFGRTLGITAACASLVALVALGGSASAALTRTPRSMSS